MTEHHTPAPPRLAHYGLGKKDYRTRMDCLRLAADSCSAQDEILSRAETFVRYIEDGADNTRDDRWICLRMACSSAHAPERTEDIIQMAARFEAFILGSQTPALC